MMIVNIIIFTVLLFAANYLFASNFYVNNKKDTLIQVKEQISQLIADDTFPLSPEITREINALAKSIGGSIVIGDNKRNVLFSETSSAHNRPSGNSYSSGSPFFEMETEEGSTRLVLPSTSKKSKVIVTDWERIGEDSLFFYAEDPELLIDTLRFQTVLDNDLSILLWVPMSSIDETIYLSNRFTLIIAMITLLITGFTSYIISKRFTNPITKMNSIAKDMLNLDFSQTLTINSEDEIGQLSETINELSRKLNVTIAELNDKNNQLTLDINEKTKLEQMQKQFISNVSHELKTPIFLIQGYAEGLHSNVAWDEEKRVFYSEVIMEEADRMDIIVKDLLDISQLESGSFSITPCTFQLDALLSDLIKKLSPIIEENQINTLITSRKNTLVVADPVRIEQVIINLLTNAVNHCSHRNEISINLEADTESSKAKLSIFNTGNPIPEESLDKIWTSFYKADESRTRDYNGSGLGLSIVKNILQVHHNQYGVINRKDGVEFWFELDLFEN